MLLVYTIVKAGDYGWGSTNTLGLGALAIALLVFFVVRQARTANPLMPLRIFRSRVVSGANAVQALMVAGLFGMFFLGSLYMERVLGYGPVEIGLAFLPVALLIGLFSLSFSARLSARFGARATLLSGLSLMAAGLALFTRAPADAKYASELLPVMALLGIGAGLSFPALMTLAMSGATPQRFGPRVRPRQHDSAGRRRARSGGAGDAVDESQRHLARERRIHLLGPDERISPRIRDRHDPGRGRARAGRDRPTPGTVGGRGGRAGPGAGRSGGGLSGGGVGRARGRPCSATSQTGWALKGDG